MESFIYDFETDFRIYNSKKLGNKLNVPSVEFRLPLKEDINVF